MQIINKVIFDPRLPSSSFLIMHVDGLDSDYDIIMKTQ